MPSQVHDISQADASSVEDLRRAVNDRLRRIGASGSFQITGDLDMHGNRIVNLGAPGGLKDAATLADVRRGASRPAASASSVQTSLDGITVRPERE